MFQHFLNDLGLREAPKQMTSKDGAFTLPATPYVVKKPGQKLRPQATKTEKLKCGYVHVVLPVGHDVKFGDTYM